MVSEAILASLGVGQNVTIQIAFAPQATRQRYWQFYDCKQRFKFTVFCCVDGLGDAAGSGEHTGIREFRKRGGRERAGLCQLTFLIPDQRASRLAKRASPATGFTIVGSPTGQTIQPGQSFSFTAQFSPTSVGNATGSISIASNAPNSPMTIALTGAGTEAGLGVSPSAVNFKGVVVGSSGTATLNLSNSGSAAVTISQASVAGTGFTISGLAAGLTIQPGQNSSFTAKFLPTSTGSASGSISSQALAQFSDDHRSNRNRNPT